jgi:hypothetical protein
MRPAHARSVLKSDWTLQAWHWVLEGEVATPRPAPEWFKIPAMMRMTVSTPAVLGLLEGFTKPFNFVHVPLLFPNLYPAGKDQSDFGLITPFSKHRAEWLKTKAIDTHSGKRYSICLLDPKGRTKKIEVKCYGNILGSYREHPEAKFLGSDGEPCNKLTRGLLRRSHIVASQHRSGKKRVGDGNRGTIRVWWTSNARNTATERRLPIKYSEKESSKLAFGRQPAPRKQTARPSC